jgi:hypothetical protein
MPNNPYSRGSAFPDLSSQIGNFTDNLVRLKMNDRNLGMESQKLAEQTRQHEAMLPIQQGQLAVQQGNLAANQEQNVMAAKKFATENPQAQPWNTSNFMRMSSKLKLAGIPVDDIPFMNDLKTFAADPTMLRGDVAGTVEMKWPEWAAQTSDSLTQKVGKLSEQAANLPDNDPKREEIGKQIEKTIKAQQMLEGIPADKVKQIFFPDIHQWEQNQKSNLLEMRQGFQNELLQNKFDQWKEVQGIKFQNAKELQDAKYDFLKNLKLTNIAGDVTGRRILQGAYQEQLRDVDIQLRTMNPLQYGSDEEFQAAKVPLEQRRNDIMNDLKELSGVEQKKDGGDVMKSMPPAAQHKDRTIRDTGTGKRYKSNGSAWVEVK